MKNYLYDARTYLRSPESALLKVSDNKTTYEQMNKLQESQDWTKMIRRVEAKTGVDMDSDLILLAWGMCQEERAWYYPFHPVYDYPAWCSLFSRKDLKLLEFSYDLKEYYMLGPAYKITSKMSQPVFKVGFHLQFCQTFKS